MTDKQIRNRIVGALSVSMMPMAAEAECVRFLDRCMEQISWHSAKQLPPMEDKSFDDFGELVEYKLSEPLLAYTEEQEMVTVRCSMENGRLYWVDDDGTEYAVTHWRKLPQAPEVKSE